MVSSRMLGQDIYPYLDIDMRKYNIDRYDRNSLERYNVIKKLITDVENNRSDNVSFNIGKMPENYIDYVREALAFALANKKQKDIQLIKNHEFDYYFHYRSRPQGVILANEILNDTLTIKNTFKMQLYTYLNTAYQDLGLYTEFIEVIPKMYSLKKEMNLESYTTADQESDVGKSYYLNKRYESAIQYYYRALDNIKGEKGIIFKAKMHNNIGLSFGNLSVIDSALVHYDKAMSLLKNKKAGFEEWDKNYSIYFYNVIERNKAELLFADAEPEKVIPYALKEFHTFPDTLNPIYITNTLNLLGKLYFSIGEYHQATAYLLMARENMKPGILAEDQIENFETEAQIHLVSGDKKTSSVWFKKQKRFEDSISKVKNDTRVAIALTAYDTKQKEIAIKDQELRIQHQESTLKQEKQKQLLYVVIIGSFIVLIVFGYFYIKKINKQKEKIISQKKELDESLFQKELLLKEVHHRVKNNLQIVSSLLEGQADKTEDKKLKSIMVEGQERIDAMALIHQQLYKSENFKSIDLKNYVNNLFQHLYTSQNKEGVQVNYILDIEVLPIDIDIAVPFGIILNELISNCYKYAFKNRTKGTIEVSIKAVDEKFYKLTVLDNGVGLPKDFETKKNHSLGIKLIEGISWQLRGELSYNTSEKGSIFEVLFIKSFEKIND